MSYGIRCAVSCVAIGDVESTQPTKTLMKVAEYIDTHTHGGEQGGREGGREGGGLKEWFLGGKTEVLDMLSEEVGRCEREMRGRGGRGREGER